MVLPNVSILIVARNSEKDLPKLFASIQKLNYPRSRLEIIYVDDDSTDNSFKLGEKFADRAFHFNKRQGRAKVRNFALKKANHDLIAWIDADCEIVDRNWLQNMLKYMKDSVIGVAGTQLKPRKGISRVAWYLPGLALVVKKEKFASWAPTTSSLFQKKPLLDAGGFKEKLITAEDLEICWRLAKKNYKFMQIPQAQIIHNFRTSFGGFIYQQFERGYHGGQLLKQYAKSGYSLLNLALFFMGLGVILTMMFPILLWVWVLFPLFVYLGLGYLDFFPLTLVKYLSEEKSFTGALQLIALQYMRTYSLLFGLLKYEAENFYAKLND